MRGLSVVVVVAAGDVQGVGVGILLFHRREL